MPDLSVHGERTPPTSSDLLALAHPDDRRDMAGMAHAIKVGGPFAHGFRIVLPNGEIRWIEACGIVEVDADGRPVREICANVDLTDYKRAACQTQLLLGELHHRVKNSFALVAALVDLSAQSDETDVRTFAAQLRSRIDCLATAHNLSFIGEAATPVPLIELTRHLLDPWCGLNRRRVRIDGDVALVVAAEHVSVVALVIHELATNAVKYGVLGRMHGQLSIEIAMHEDGRTRLLWIERQPDHDATRASRGRETRSGFGTTMINRSLAFIGGSIERAIATDRFEVSLLFPVA